MSTIINKPEDVHPIQAKKSAPVINKIITLWCLMIVTFIIVILGMVSKSLAKRLDISEIQVRNKIIEIVSLEESVKILNKVIDFSVRSIITCWH